MLNRRDFLQQAGLTAGSVLLSGTLMKGLASEAAEQRLTILHTNDVHSRLDPFPMDGSRNAGKGGVMVASQRSEQ